MSYGGFSIFLVKDGGEVVGTATTETDWTRTQFSQLTRSDLINFN